MASRNKSDIEQDSDASEKTDNTYASELQAAVIRAQELTERIRLSPIRNESLVLDAIGEIETYVEQLRIVEEELRQQNDELVSARLELEQEQFRYEDLFESAPVGYLITDSTGTITKANRAVGTLLGINCKYLSSKALSTFVTTADRSAFLSQLRAFSHSGSLRTTEFELGMVPRDRDPFDASLKITSIRGRDGEIVELRWLIRDITQVKKASQRMLRLNAELEDRVRQRTAELEQANLLKDELLMREQRARAEAEAANRSKDEFLAIVSHELRTPLNAILGWAQLISRDTCDPEQRLHAARVIERSARSQARLISDILDISRVISGSLPLEIRRVKLDRVIEVAVEDARPAIDAKNIRLRIIIDEAPAFVMGDFPRLQQVIGNLLSNAIKFTGRGGEISVSLSRAEDSLEVTVTDSGEGISPQFLPFVFDRFRQADSQTTRQHGGLGLGLAIVKVLVELHRGKVSAASDGEHKGSTFTVSLPAATSADLSLTDAAAGSQRELGDPASPLASVWVVVVDDDSDAQEMMRAVLEGSGARVTTCGSFEEALSVFGENESGELKLPHVLVADIAMPGMDGFDLIRAIRKLDPSRGGQIPAIALTAYADEETRNRVLDEGYQKHLTKPLNLEELVIAIASSAHATPPQNLARCNTFADRIVGKRNHHLCD